MAEDIYLPKREIISNKEINKGDEILPRLGFVEPYECESISHYLGRVRRFKANSLPSGYSLGKIAGIGAVTTRWEKLYLNPFPSETELEALAKVIEVEVERLRQMLPPKGMTMKPRPIRLCAACYAESPHHRIEWQFKDVMVCDRHQLPLSTKCKNCGTPFPIPADWVRGECPHCCLSFTKMAKRQKSG
ncbi:TniQ family protein [Calothrix sp. PCC 6303]|uniref:TniQ family protein n=1 Tax=Calothrix sp. PCC 6303 TaxID=1170562 RepID=UPI0002A02C67|nr:TniQ family protein [Calothrix sp. PCC 6303]AFZ00422.1 hypothetical protein Cal6303_1365 [Calothrix sp. PCC 6303]